MPPHDTPLPAPLSEEPEAGSYTLSMLLSGRGRVAPEKVLAFMHDGDRHALIVEGRRVATKRVVKECARLYREVSLFLAKATPEQLANLPALTEDFLFAAASAALHGEELDLDAHTSRSEATVRRITVDRTEAAAHARRNVLRVALQTLAGGDLGRLGEIETAYGMARDRDELAASLDRLCAVGRSLVEEARTRGQSTRLDAGYFGATRALAARLRAVEAPKDTFPPVDEATQNEIDYWDGVNLWFVETVLDMFDAAHQADATIPRLALIDLHSLIPPARP